jgi:hypothetical protein
MRLISAGSQVRVLSRPLCHTPGGRLRREGIETRSDETSKNNIFELEQKEQSGKPRHRAHAGSKVPWRESRGTILHRKVGATLEDSTGATIDQEHRPGSLTSTYRVKRKYNFLPFKRERRKSSLRQVLRGTPAMVPTLVREFQLSQFPWPRRSFVRSAGG